MRVRLYIPEAEKGKKAYLNKEQIRHLKVLRLQEGETISIFNGKGHEYEVVYSEKVSEGITLEKVIPPRSEPESDITLATAVPKGNRMDYLIEKVSELGVNKIVPTIFHRSIVVPRDTKIERLQKIAIEACAQSERSIVPIISECVKFDKLIETFKEYDTVLSCHKTGTGILTTNAKKILIIIGPEGDFTPEEIQKAEQHGAKKVSLAQTILRIETAAITAIAQTMKPK